MSSLWHTILSNSVVASGLAVAALLLGRSPRRAATAHLVWLAVLVKLLTPPLFVYELPTPAPRAASVARGAEGESRPGPMTREDGQRGPLDPGAGRPVVAAAPRDLAATPVAKAIPGPRPWGAIIGSAWAVLSIALALVTSVRIGKFRRRMIGFPRASGEIRAIAAGLSSRLDLRRVPEVVIAPEVLPPLVWWLGGPAIVVLPAHLVERWGPDELTAVLAHELAHVRRGDHLVRLLELACAVALPWHPLVWLAIRRLRELEERCCDARALEVGPDRPRAYALALVTTLEFLSGRRVPAVPLRTAIRSAHPLARRIAMLGQTPPRRLTPPGLALVAGLVAAPLALTFAQAPTPTVRPDSIVRPVDPPAGPAIVRGRVVDKDGAPVADARVRLAIPAADLRFADVTIGAPNPLPKVRFREARTDAEGRYEFGDIGLAGKAEASFDVLKPGFRRLVGTLMAGGDARSVGVEPDRTVEVPLTLTEPSRHVRGVVVDEAGRPIPGVVVDARFVDDESSGGIEMTSTRDDGTFEVFNVDLEPHHWRGEKGTNLVHFSHPDYLGTQIEDLDAAPDPGRDGFRVVLEAGRSIGGIVVDEAGRPVAGAEVAAEARTTDDAMPSRKGTRTDAAGRFSLRGLADEMTILRASAYSIKQQATVPLPVDAPEDFRVRLAAMAMPVDLKVHDVLGMKLANQTPETRAIYHLWPPRGVVILEPGANHDRLGIGELGEGYVFWLVGDHEDGNRVRDVRDFVDRILAEAKTDEAKTAGVRVVYSFATPEAVGNNTRYLKPTPDDLRELQALADRLAK